MFIIIMKRPNYHGNAFHYYVATPLHLVWTLYLPYKANLNPVPYTSSTSQPVPWTFTLHLEPVPYTSSAYTYPTSHLEPLPYISTLYPTPHLEPLPHTSNPVPYISYLDALPYQYPTYYPLPCSYISPSGS